MDKFPDKFLMMNFKWYQRWWFWVLSILVSSALVFNLVASVVWGNEQANLFTAISGWVSGLATVSLGLIAVWQNKRYKEQGEIYNKQILDLTIKPELYVNETRGITQSQVLQQNDCIYYFIASGNKIYEFIINNLTLPVVKFNIDSLKLIDLGNDKFINAKYQIGLNTLSTIFYKDDAFVIKFNLNEDYCDKKIRLVFTLTFQNTYNMNYRKIIEITKDGDSLVFYKIGKTEEIKE